MRRIARSIVLLAVAVGISIVIAGARAAADAVESFHEMPPKICPCVAHVRCHDVAVTSADGTRLSGWYYEPDNPNGGAILMLHGVGGNRTDVIGLASVYEQAGYAVLAPDIRGHGASGGLTTYGIDDEQDVVAWTEWLAHQPNVQRMYGYGASLGGSVILESLNRHPQFSAVIAESPYSDFPSIANERITRAAPDGLKWLAPSFVESGLLWARLRYGIDFRRSSPIDAVRHSGTPILVAHGLLDDKTSPHNAEVIAAANRASVKLWLAPKAGHADLWHTDKPEFERRTLAWFASH